MRRATRPGESAGLDQIRQQGAYEPFYGTAFLDNFYTSTLAYSSGHTKGAWTQIVASTTLPTQWLWFYVSSNATPGVATPGSIDIGTGGAGAETVVVPDILVGYADSSAPQGAKAWQIPIAIPAGTRVAARVQGNGWSASNVTFFATLHPPSSARYARHAAKIDALSTFTTSTSLGVGITSTSYTEVVASTAIPYRGLIFSTGCNGATTVTHGPVVVFAKGASGSESDIFTLVIQQTTSESQLWMPATIPIWYGHIPAGTRIAAKLSIAHAHGIDVMVHGIPYS